MEMYGIFRIKTMPRAAENLVGMFSFEDSYSIKLRQYHNYRGL